MSPKKLIAARDPFGFRPFSPGKLGDSYVAASETCAFDSIGAEFVREVRLLRRLFYGELSLSSAKRDAKG